MDTGYLFTRRKISNDQKKNLRKLPELETSQGGNQIKPLFHKELGRHTPVSEVNTIKVSYIASSSHCGLRAIGEKPFSWHCSDMSEEKWNM